MATTTAVPVGSLPRLGDVPQRMYAQVVRQDRLGEPATAFQIEEIDTLENHLMAHAAIAAAAVIALPDERWGERPLGVAVLREGASASPDELREHLSERFAKWQLPDRFEFVDAIPRTATGKFKKSELRQQFVERVT